MTEERENEGIFNDKKLFVGNLSFSITKTELVNIFNPFGVVIGVNIREDRNTNKPKGFGFITFESSQSATDALSLNGTMFEGRVLTVKRATLRGSENQDSKKDKSWITVPTQPKPSNKNFASTSTVNIDTTKLSGRKTWDQWTGPS